MFVTALLVTSFTSPLLAPRIAAPKIVGRSIEYEAPDGTTCEGYVAYDASKRGKHPVVLVVHDWDGLGSYEMRRARELAGLGYVGFAIDVYGKGVRPQGEERGKTAGRFYADPALFTARLTAGYRAAVRVAQADPGRVGAIGYCFGGGGVLALGRAGLPIRALVTFHGSVGPTDKDGKIKGTTLVLHGDRDPIATPKDVRAFAASMRRAGRPVRVVLYPGAVHAFSVPEAGKDASTGIAYDAAADRKSFAEMRAFLRQNLR